MIFENPGKPLKRVERPIPEPGAGKTSATILGFTRYHIDGGYAEYALADYRYCFPVPKAYSDAAAALVIKP